MDIKELRYFCRVYEEQGINKAAKQLFISPQGLSKIIQHLEEEFQAMLFERSQKGMIPTECGTYLYQQSQTLIHQMETIEMGIKKIRDKEQNFEISFSCGVLNLFPFEILDKLKNTYKQVHIYWNEAGNDEVYYKLKKNQIDVAFVIGKVNDPSLYVQEIYQKKLEVIVYEEHPYYHKEKLYIKDLENQPLITLNEKFYSYHSLVQRCLDFGFVPTITLKTMESQLIYRFCEEKLGLGIDVNIHQNRIYEHGLKRIELYDSIPWTISLIVSKERVKEDIIQTLINLFKCQK